MVTSGFVGRTDELRALAELVDGISRGGRADRGIAVALRGRRRVGKSRLVTEFARQSGLPTVYFQAARGAPQSEELKLLSDAVADSDVPDAARARDQNPGSLTSALRLLASALPEDRPTIVVIDELPWLLEGFEGGAGELQRVWDRELSAKPLLLLLLGSDLAMMRQLTSADQPFFGRSVEMVLAPLNPRDVARLTGLDAMTAFDAHLITGGLPLLAQEWRQGMSRADFLGESFQRPTSALVVTGARSLDNEFPETSSARAVLTAIGGRGERTFTGILQTLAGRITAATLTSTLAALHTKGVIAADEPLSTRRAAKDKRWRISDSALRFWLAFVEPAIGDIDRGRGDLALARVSAGFDAWRGRAVEPVARGALERLLPADGWPQVTRVGGWWPRTNNPEIDLVGGDGEPARAISFVGSIKWRASKPVTTDEVDHLVAGCPRIPGVTDRTRLVAVCPAGGADSRLARTWTAEDLLSAWAG